MKIALGQLSIFPGQLEHNFLACQQMIEQAKAEQADLIVFPEMAISGYFLSDKWSDRDWVKTIEAYNDKLKALSDGIGIIWGSVATSINGQTFTHHDGKSAIFNCAFFAYNQSWVTRSDGSSGPYVKQLLPTYRMFDDHRYFMDGQRLSQLLPSYKPFAPFLFKNKNHRIKVGLEVCEDLWSDHYPVNPSKQYSKSKVDIIVNVSTSPWTINKEKSRLKQVIKHNAYNKAPVVFVNASGAQNNGKNVILLDGGSFISHADGSLIGSCNQQFESECAIIDLTNPQPIKQPNQDKLLTGLIKGIQLFDKQQFNSKVSWIIGLSGGIDSSVNAALLVLALGSSRVIGYNLPSQYNQPKTINNAKQLAAKLQIPCHVVSIETLVQATTATLETANVEVVEPSHVLENVQARLRGHLLSTLAAVNHGVIINNGNKVETALGYCTLYGDTIGALSPLGDCTKMQIFDLAKAINAKMGEEFIPTNLIPTSVDHQLVFDLYPSAELKHNQLDPMKWGYHDWLINQLLEYPNYQLDKLLLAYMDKTIWKQDIGGWLKTYGLDDPAAFLEDLLWVINQMENSVFKRIQMPPNIVVSRGAFGQDFRESQGKNQANQTLTTFIDWVFKQTGSGVL